jgi:hypothetical protein
MCYVSANESLSFAIQVERKRDEFWVVLVEIQDFW